MKSRVFGITAGVIVAGIFLTIYFSRDSDGEGSPPAVENFKGSSAEERSIRQKQGNGFIGSRSLEKVANNVGDARPSVLEDAGAYRSWLERWYHMDLHDYRFKTYFLQRSTGLTLPDGPLLLKDTIWFPTPVGAETFWRELIKTLELAKQSRDLAAFGYKHSTSSNTNLNEDGFGMGMSEFGEVDLESRCERLSIDFSGGNSDEFATLYWKPGGNFIGFNHLGEVRPKKLIVKDLVDEFGVTAEQLLAE